jgi:hypothetical protein
MEYTHLGRTGLTVSRIALGTLKAAAPENLPTAHGLMDRALEHRSRRDCPQLLFDDALERQQLPGRESSRPRQRA